MAATIAILAMPVGVSLADAPIVQGHLPSGSSTSATATSVPAPLNASATTQTPDQALVTGDSDTAVSANPLDMGNQIAMLQQQVQELRGQLEVQAHTIAQLQSEISQLSGGKFPAITNSSAPAVAPVAAPQAVNPAAVTASSVASADPSFAAATPENSVAPAASATATSIPAPTETQLYQKAYDLMVAKQYTEASVQLQTYLQSYPNGQYAAESHYSLGEMALISGNLSQAQAQFNVVINQFAQSPKVPDAMLKVGMIFSSQSKWKQASSEFNLVIREYPGTPSAQMAQQQLEEIQKSGN